MPDQKNDLLLVLTVAIMEMGGEYEQRADQTYKTWAQADLDTSEWERQEIKRIENEAKTRRETARRECETKIIELANEIARDKAQP